MAESFEYAVRKDVRNNPIVREVDHARQRELWKSVGLTFVAVVLALFFAWHVFWPNGWTAGMPTGGLDYVSLAIGAIAVLALFRFKAGVIPVILACGAAGMASALALR